MKRRWIAHFDMIGGSAVGLYGLLRVLEYLSMGAMEPFWIGPTRMAFSTALCFTIMGFARFFTGLDALHPGKEALKIKALLVPKLEEV